VIKPTHFALAAGLGLAALGLAAQGPAGGARAADQGWQPAFTADGQLILPKDALWRSWVYIGTPLTPNALNGGEAPFPEFHSVYMEPGAFAHYQRTGELMEGTVLAKELARVRAPDGAHPDGSTDEVSGRGFFMGELSGFEIAIKSRALFPDEPGNWAYFSFGHHAPPYAQAAARLPAETCNACHQAAADEDFVFTRFYPVLRAAKP